MLDRERLERSSPDLAAQIDLGCLLAWSRHPASRESEALQAYSRKYGLENCCRLLPSTNCLPQRLSQAQRVGEIPGRWWR